MHNIPVGSGQKITRTATVKDNAAIKNTLSLTKRAIKEGRLDDFWSLTTFDNKDGKFKDRTMTISELDLAIEENRQDKIRDIEFAEYQINLFSRYLKKNVHAADHGYSASMVLNFISPLERRKLLEIIFSELEAIKSSDFVEGKFHNMRGGPETLMDRLDVTLDNKYHNQELVEN